jgi:cation diffusion facilitator CzcD-associated flavoprotein CzcO
MMSYRRQIRMVKDLRNTPGQSRLSTTLGGKKARKVPTSLSNTINIDSLRTIKKIRYTSYLCILPSCSSSQSQARGVQAVPNLQPIVEQLDHYARSGAWIAGAFAGSLERQLEPINYSAEQLESFQDSEKYRGFRKKLESTSWRRYKPQLNGTRESEQAITDFKKLMSKRIETKPELLDDIVPDFSPHCRRLTPGPGYLEALTKENASSIRTPIEKITEDGIVTRDSVHRPVDAIICSTGANVDFAPPFPIVAEGVDLSQAWRPKGLCGFPYTYLGVATPGFPNLLFLHGESCPDSEALLGIDCLRRHRSQCRRSLRDDYACR